MIEFIRTISIWALPTIFAITLHEAAHGYVARHFGDQTAYLSGRVTLNPIAHIDLFGTILLPLLILLSSSFAGIPPVLFGWAKPVPVNWQNLRRPKKDMIWVAAAGPAMNLLMVIVWLLIFIVCAELPEYVFSQAMIAMSKAGMMINLVLMWLNLLPILPLDGGRIVNGFLPKEWSISYQRLEHYGMWILLFLVFSGLLEKILSPLLNLSVSVIQFFLS